MRLVAAGVGVVVVVAVSLAAIAADEPRLVPDPGYRAKAGDKAVIDSKRPLAFKTVNSYVRGYKLLSAKKEDELQKLRESGELVELTNRVAVQCVQWIELEPRTSGRTYSPSEFARDLQAAQLDDSPSNAMKVQILEGPHAGETLIVKQDDVAKLIPAPKLTAKQKARLKAQEKAKAKARSKTTTAPR